MKEGKIGGISRTHEIRNVDHNIFMYDNAWALIVDMEIILKWILLIYEGHPESNATHYFLGQILLGKNNILFAAAFKCPAICT
jgi:hypothetical protein